jgi:hypothetical protein
MMLSRRLVAKISKTTGTGYEIAVACVQNLSMMLSGRLLASQHPPTPKTKLSKTTGTGYKIAVPYVQNLGMMLSGRLLAGSILRHPKLNYLNVPLTSACSTCQREKV